MKPTTRGALALAALFLLAAAPARAQESCETLLQAAIADYEQGRFEPARDAVSRCLAAQPRRAEKIQAYAVLARVELALDHMDAAQAALGRLLDADPEFQPQLFDAPRFVRLLAEVRKKRQAPVVSSVSKSVESLREAPATVIVITGDDIRRRGYLDIEAVLHDLPGFDFSKRAGASYSNIYQRGYRSLETNRTLLMVDGVEDNDLASSTAWISRQIALSNIDRIEVVYGPASTMYGANAFAGVVNIITKDPRALVAEGRKLGGDLRGATDFSGDYSLDGALAGQTSGGDFAWSVTARRWAGDDFDHLEDTPEWDFDPAFYTGYDYKTRPTLNVTTPAAAQALVARYGEAAVSRYYDIARDDSGQVTSLQLNAAGDAAARQLDQGAFGQTVAGEPVGFGLPVDDWQVYAKMQTANFLFGIQHWTTKESANVPLVDSFAASGKNGFLWTPRHTFLFARYSRRFAEDKVSLTSFTQYRRHDLDGTRSANVFLRNYHLGNLGPADLLDGRSAFWAPAYNYRNNDQLRTELSVFYEQSEKLSAVAGVELRLSSVGAKNVASTTERPSETGAVPAPIPGDNQLASRDIGAYLQGSWKPWTGGKLVLGGRLDNNRIRESGGFGTVFNPRVAIVQTKGEFVFKGIYAEAFQDAPNFQKFETTALRMLDNPTLAPETVQNFELSASFERGDFAAQLVGYRANYEGIVAEVSGVPCPPTLGCTTTNQFQNVGRLEIEGLQGEATWTPGAYRLSGNYTWTRPRDPDRDLRVGDIAGHRVNLLGGWTRGQLDVELRFNWVLGRITGAGTTVNLNPYREMPDYAILGGAITYRRVVPGIDVQLSFENLFDGLYYDPSLRNPSGFPIAARIPQPGRAVYLQLRASR
jgi:outer membrane receptor for ferrienterochelin and colicin